MDSLIAARTNMEKRTEGNTCESLTLPVQAREEGVGRQLVELDSEAFKFLSGARPCFPLCGNLIVTTG